MVLVEIGQLLGSYLGRYAVVGGAVPWLLLDQSVEAHVGTLDIDLALDHEALAHDEYALLIDALMRNGYQQGADMRRFQLARTVQVDGGEDVRIVVDFLMARDAVVQKNIPALIDNFAVQKASGVDLANTFSQTIYVSGDMPQGGTNRVQIAVCSIPALLAMKGHALNGRMKSKDAYDVVYSIRNFPGHIEALAAECFPVLEQPSGLAGFKYIEAKFDSENGFGPTTVRRFVEESGALAGLTPAQWQADAFGQVDALMRALKLR